MRYQTLDKIKKKNADYNLIMSGRSTGKSTSMCKELVEDYLKKGRKAIRLFRRLSYMVDCATWFDDFSKGGQFDCGHVITFDGAQYLMDGEPFCYTACLSISTRYKGVVWDKKIYHMVFDEYIEITQLDYLENEISKFKNMISTVFRMREGKVWLLGNNINEDSKHNPYHRFFGIDIDRQNIKQGQIRMYESKEFDDPATIAFEYGRIAYTTESEVPKLQRISGNEVATTGEFAEVWDVFKQKDEYPRQLSWLLDGVDEYFVTDGAEQSYFPIINDDKQTIDWVRAPHTIEHISQYQDEDYYNKLINYPDYYLEELGETEYYEALQLFSPHEQGIPLYDNYNRYGKNCTDFLAGLRQIAPGYTQRYADGNIKYIVTQIIIQDKHEQ